MKPAAFEGSTPTLDLTAFFTGHTHSTGVFERRAGRPAQRITTTTVGVMKDGVLNIEQDLVPEKGKRSHRSWQLRRIDAHRVDATASDMRGVTRGEAYGNTASWSFMLKLSPTSPLRNVRMSQYMYLQPDGMTLIIRSVIRKAGIIVAELTEQFVKE